MLRTTSTSLLSLALLLAAPSAGPAQGIATIMGTLDQAGFDVGEPGDLTPEERARFTSWFRAYQQGGRAAALAAGAKLRRAVPADAPPAPRSTQSAATPGPDALQRQQTMKQMQAMMQSLAAQLEAQQGELGTAGDQAALMRGQLQAVQKMFGQPRAGSSEAAGSKPAPNPMTSPFEHALLGLRQSLDAMEARGATVADLRRKLAALTPEGKRLDQLTAQVMQAAMSGRQPPEVLTKQLEAKSQALEPRLEALSKAIAARMQAAGLAPAAPSGP